MSKKYKHIFFDLDHTLWDFDKNSENTLRQLYDEYDLAGMGIKDFTEFKENFNNHSDRLWTKFRSGLIRREELRWKRFWFALLDFKIADTSLAHEMSSAYLEILPTQTTLIPFAKEVLEHCNSQECYTIHLITNGFEATQRLKLQFSGIASYFSELITSEKSNSMKPHADIYEYAMKVTGAKTEECIMIGDALEIDILGAINAGWDQVYYNPAKTAHNQKPTYEVHQLSDLVTIL
jgi:putative hydrolase of the HAD superfamily